MVRVNTKITREEWCEKIAESVRKDLFKPLGYELPKKVQFAVALPVGKRTTANGRVAGQCLSTSYSTKKYNQITVSPDNNGISKAGSMFIINVIIHELIHTLSDCRDQHKGGFVVAMQKIGLAGKPTSTIIEPKSELEKYANTLLNKYGLCNHAKVNYDDSGKQTTRNKLIECNNAGCGFKFRASRTAIFGAMLNICTSCERKNTLRVESVTNKDNMLTVKEWKVEYLKEEKKNKGGA